MNDFDFKPALAIWRDVLFERARQHAAHGEQNIPIAHDSAADLLPSEACTRRECEWAENRGVLSYGHLLVEELAEVMSAPTPEAQRAELVQVAALAVQAIECLDREATK
jgi:hypothetical protein